MDRIKINFKEKFKEYNGKYCILCILDSLIKNSNIPKLEEIEE